jgi:hypothetical protein
MRKKLDQKSKECLMMGYSETTKGYRVKQNPDGTVDRFKARLVAKGYSQKYGIDYLDTFAPVIKMVSKRVILCIALSKGLKVKQKDVDVAFLNSKVKERLIMEVPEGLETPLGKVLEMKKMLIWI